MVEPLLEIFDSYTDDTPVHMHRHRLQVEYIGSAGLPSPVDWERLECSAFVPGIPVA